MISIKTEPNINSINENSDIIDLSDAVIIQAPSDWTSKDGTVIKHHLYKNFYEQI